MSNEIAKKKNNYPAGIADMAVGLARSAGSIKATGGDPFMKMTKFGDWVYGTEGTVVEDGSHWVVNPQQLKHGWTAWGTKAHGTDGTNVGEVLVAATEPLPGVDSLPEVKGEWSKAISMMMVCVSGEDEGCQVELKMSSTGMRNAFSELLQDIIGQIQAGDDYVPTVTLGNDSYQHKTYGKIFVPELTVVNWSDGMPASTDEGEEDAEEAPKVEEKQPVEEPAADPETQEAAPRRRRRRAS